MSTVFIQNIVSPYRNHFFNELVKVMPDFVVYYMGESEPDRNWDVTSFKREYPNWIDKHGFTFYIGGFISHLNPLLLWKVLCRKDFKNIILAVSWTDPNIIAIVLAKKLHITRKKLFFWAEANYTAEWSKLHNSKFKKWLKRTVFNSIDGGMIIPGHMSEITFEKWGIDVTRYIILPNTIDDSSLRYEPGKRCFSGTPVFLMPIRIIESVKGGLNFFQAIGDENVRRAIFIIAGDGQDKARYESFIVENHYEEHIFLVGFCDSKRMTTLYNEANVLLLPSFSDPSPLSLVEACYFHLPILCSNHCGNHFEAVKEGENGFTFNPTDRDEIKRAYEKLFLLRNQWDSMGEVSASIYHDVFETNVVVGSFIEEFRAVTS